MGSNDQEKQFPCVCGKVFRRQLALERHMDVHHSPKSRKRGFKALEDHTVLTTQTMSYFDSMAQLGSQCLVEDTTKVVSVAGGGVPTDRNKKLPPEAGIRGFHGMDSVSRRSRMVSSSHAEKEMLLTGIDTSPELAASGSLTAGAYQLNDDEISTSIRSITESLGEESGLNSVDNEQQCFAGENTVSAVAALQGPSPSEVFRANDDRCQSVHFSDMAAEEEIVSETVFQLSDQLPREFSALPWPESDRRTSVMATDESNASAYLNRQSPDDPALSVNASRLLKRRASKNKLEPKSIVGRPGQSRGPEEEEDPLDDVSMDGLEGDYGQADLVGLATTRQVHGNRVPFVCGICHKRFDSEKYLSMHMPLHRLYLDYSTTDGKIAVATASSLDTLPDLSATQHGGQPGTRPIVAKETQHWTCQHCNKVFTQNSNYKNHMRTHSDERPFVCEICNIGFKERYHLKKHVLFKHTTDLKEKCRVCGKCFKDTTAVRAHERIHSEVRPYSCPLCGKTFKTSECLWHHENRSKTCGKSAKRLLEAASDFAEGESVLLPDRLEMSSARRTRKPPRQGGRVSNPRRTQATPALSDSDAAKQFSDAADDEISSEMEASLLAIKAEEADCDLFYPNLQTLFHNDQELENILELLDGEAATQDGSGPEEEEEEETGSDRTYTADRNGDEPSAKYDGLECAKCGKKFSSSATFAKHMTMHSEERPYRCTLCDNRFKLKVHLKKHHLYRHSNEYPCECSICGKRFKDSSAVRLHEKIHSADRPFRCHCGKSFKTRENLWGHRNRGPCEKNQDFVARGIGLFQTLEFGTILGVSIANGRGVIVPSSMPVAAPATSCSFVGNPERASDLSQAQTVMMKTAQFVPSCAISAPNSSTGPSPRQLKVASVKLIKASLNETPTQLTAALPTAIVTPLPRDVTTLPASTYPTNQPQAVNNLVALSTSDIVSVESSLELLSYNTSVSSSPTIAVTEHLQKSISSNPSSSAIAAADDDGKCFTVHKFLEMSSETTGKSLGVVTQLLGNPMISDNIHDNRNTDDFCLKRRKLDSISEAQISTDCAVYASQSRRLDVATILSYPIDQDSQDYGMLPLVDPLLTNSCHSSSIYPDLDDYDDIKYDPNDPMISIGDVYWSDSDNTLLSTGWLLENDNLFSDLSLTSTFGTLQVPT